ncbi:MAG: methionyl-tRNA formyltransferase, partial [Calditrichae bacterium]|nr:methionyl-tRNA formyltransferase [Calditrichia bacterium]
MGTPPFALPTLEKIIDSHHQIVGIVTQPDRPKGRGQKLHPPPVKQAALQHHLNPIMQPESL